MDEAGRSGIELASRLEGVRGRLLFPSTVDVIVRALSVSTATRSETDSSLLGREVQLVLRHAHNSHLSHRSLWLRI